MSSPTLHEPFTIRVIWVSTIIFDCDTGVDDAMAILYGARHGADFLACTVTHGNVPVGVGTRNTLTVLDAAGLSDVPVYTGAARPLVGEVRTAEHVHGRDGLGNTDPAPSPRSAEALPAARALVELAATRPGEITLVPVGPLTNIALALQLDPDFAHNIARVVLMGGAIGVRGNASPVAEANIICDPEAAQAVLDAPWEVTFVGLEATLRTALTAPMLTELARTSTAGGRLVWEAMEFYMDSYERSQGYRTCMLHDPLAMALALDDGLAQYSYARASIELAGSHTRGMVVADLRPRARVDSAQAHEPGVLRYVTAFDVAEFHRRFLAAFQEPA